MPGRVRHRPQDSVLYRVVEEHLDEFLRIAREEHGGFPAFIEKTFRAYLDCGRPERGCIRLHCASCGHRERMGPALALVGDDEAEQPKDGIRAVVGGVTVYASRAMEDRQTIERVGRCLLRAPLSLSRLKMRDDRMSTCRLKQPARRGNPVLVLSPVELMGRLASLIPVPGHPTRGGFGVLAPGAKDRAKVVPAPTRAKRRCGQQEEARRAPVAHRIPWAELLRRVFGVDALSCGKCGAMMTALACIKDPDEAARMVAHLEAPWDKKSTGPPGLAAWAASVIDASALWAERHRRARNAWKTPQPRSVMGEGPRKSLTVAPSATWMGGACKPLHQRLGGLTRLGALRVHTGGVSAREDGELHGAHDGYDVIELKTSAAQGKRMLKLGKALEKHGGRRIRYGTILYK